MINHDRALEFYNTVYKDLIDSNKAFHFEVPQRYFNKINTYKFLNDLENFCYTDDGYWETLRLKLNPSTTHILSFSMRTVSGKPKDGKEHAYSFLRRFNKKRSLKFPYYYWNVLFEFAEIKDGEFKNDCNYFEV